MKQVFVACLFLGLYVPLKAQSDRYSALDNSAMFLPKDVTLSTISLAKYIESKYNTDLSKITAAYRWITANIRYDKDSMLAINWSKETDEKIAATLRRKKGVCDNFASVFTDVLLKMSIPSFVVNGHCKPTGRVFNQAHSWSAVRLNNAWKLCDPTWDIMYAGSPRYFMLSPDEFIGTHWPFDPMWQLLPYYVSYPAFESGHTSPNAGIPSLHMADSVEDFLALEPVQQLQAAARRMRTAGVHNEPQKNWYGYNQMNIAIVQGEKHMQTYNAAVVDLNKATSLFNAFVSYRNKMFLPVKPDQQIAAMLAPIKDLLQSAAEKTAAIRQAKENFQYDTGDLDYKLNALSRKLKEQSSFLQSYLATGIAEREELFYR